jgi:ferric-dicitrate binding protein FerR (iron transport regulator)
MTFRRQICCLALLLLPFPVFAKDTGAAMLYVKGTAWLNGSAIPDSSAIFPGDMVQTKPGTVANITSVGSNVVIGSDSLVQFQPGQIDLQHGGVTIVSERGMVVQAEGVTVTPPTGSSTQYDVREWECRVLVSARKGSVTVSDSLGTVTVAEGQEISRGKRKKCKIGQATPSTGHYGVLGTPLAKAIGIGAVGTLITISLLPDDDPVSPWHP